MHVPRTQFSTSRSLSQAMALYSTSCRSRRCSPTASSVCTLPLKRSGRIRAPWPPTLPAPGSHKYRSSAIQDDKQPLRPRDRVTFQRLGCLLVDRFEPRGSRAQYGPSEQCDASSASRMPGKHQPLVIEANQSPPNQRFGFPESGAATFHPERIPVG